MRGRGVTYDTGFSPCGSNSRESFDPAVVRREMQIIADDLHCNAVRIIGDDPRRLTLAGERAVAAGLEVWLSPIPCEMDAAEMRPFFADCADRAEDLRQRGAGVVFVTGCKLSLFASGFIPGVDFAARLSALSDGRRRGSVLEAVPAKVNSFLAEVAAGAREHFRGALTYAGIPIEGVDWRPFDIVGSAAYRSERNSPTYREEMRALFDHGKPVAVTEFGCCTYRGAADRGAGGWRIVGADGDLDDDYVRDEGEQVRYLKDMLTLFDEEDVDSAFWLTFATYRLPHRESPRNDLDVSSFGLVKILEDDTGRTYPDLNWEPKLAFNALAAAYARTKPGDRRQDGHGG